MLAKWALISMVLWHNECTWVLMSTHGLMASWAWLLNSHECLLLHCPKLMSVHGRLWELIGNQEHSWSMSANWCSWVTMIAHEKQLWKAMNTHELGVMEQWALMRGKHSHEDGAMGPWAWALIITHERSLRHSTILMSAHECSWPHMSAYESS